MFKESEVLEVRKQRSLGMREKELGKTERWELNWGGTKKGNGARQTQRRAWLRRTEIGNQGEFSTSRISVRERGLREPLAGMEWPQRGDVLKKQAS